MSVLAWLAAAVSSFFSSSVARYLALKIILTALFIITLPIVLNNVFYKIMEALLTQASTHITSQGLSSATVQLTGLAAFFGSHLRLPEAISILLAAVAVKVTLRLIPFVKVVN